MQELLKLALDTTTIVPAFFWEGNEAELIRKIEKNKADLFITIEILDEVEEVIKRPKFKELLDKTNQTPEQILTKLISLSHLVVGPKLKKTIVSEDPSDDKFIECAVNAKAGYIVSVDKHLLGLKEYEGIKIIRTFDALKLI